MTWTYSGNPADSDLDAIRCLIGDTNASDQLLTDEEITYFIGKTVDVSSAAYECARNISMRFARLADKVLGPLRIYYQDRAKTFIQLAEQILGTSIKADFPEVDAPTDYISRGMMDNNG